MSQIIDLSPGLETGPPVYPGLAVTIDSDLTYSAHGPDTEFDYSHIEKLTHVNRPVKKRFRFAGFPLKLKTNRAKGTPCEPLPSKRIRGMDHKVLFH